MPTLSSDEIVSRRPFGRHPDHVSIMTVSGIDSSKVLRQNLRIARGFTAISVMERKAYERSREVGRKQHGFPSQQEVAL